MAGSNGAFLVSWRGRQRLLVNRPLVEPEAKQLTAADILGFSPVSDTDSEAEETSAEDLETSAEEAWRDPLGFSSEDCKTSTEKAGLVPVAPMRAAWTDVDEANDPETEHVYTANWTKTHSSGHFVGPPADGPPQQQQQQKRRRRRRRGARRP